MHRKLLVAGFAAAALVLAGCSSDSDGDAAETTAETTAETAEEVEAETTDIEEVEEEVADEVTSDEEAAAGPTTDDSDCAAEENICIGLVTDTGKVDDKSFICSRVFGGGWKRSRAYKLLVPHFMGYHLA